MYNYLFFLQQEVPEGERYDPAEVMAIPSFMKKKSMYLFTVE